MVSWNTKHPKRYRKGDTVTIVCFAWLPIECSDNVTRWLVRLKHTYHCTTDGALYPSLWENNWVVMTVKKS